MNAGTGAGGSMPLPRVLRMFWVGSVVAFGLMLLVSYIEYRMGFSKWHYNPLAGDRYQDLMEFWPAYLQVHGAVFFGNSGYAHLAYPPFGAAVYALVYGTGHPIAVYLGTAALWLVAGVWGMRRRLMGEGICARTATLFPLTVALVSFPIVGLLQRGNIELFLWVIAGTGTWAFLRGRESWAAVLWGMAAAMKLYPVVFLALLLPRGKWRAMALGLVTFAGTTLLAAWWLGPTVEMDLRGALGSVFGYQGVRASHWTLHELMANHTAYNLAKMGATMIGLPAAKLTLTYYGCGAVVLGMAFFGKLWKMPVANQLLAITAFMVAFPPISYFYTLVQLYAPWIVLVFVTLDSQKAGAEKAGVTLRGLRGTMFLFLPLFGSFMLLTFPRVFLFGGLLQGVMLIILFCCALEFPFGVVEERT
jgi:Glycosyltransferase family 87